MRIGGYLTVLSNSPRIAASFQQGLLVFKSGAGWQAALPPSLLAAWDPPGAVGFKVRCGGRGPRNWALGKAVEDGGALLRTLPAASMGCPPPEEGIKVTCMVHTGKLRPRGAEACLRPMAR